MLKLVLYNHLNDVASLPFVDRHEQTRLYLITPSPGHADTVRNILTNEMKVQADVMTVAKFIRDQYGDYSKKADLILKLAPIWQKFNPEASYEEFMRAFNLFTELRSFTLDKTLILEVLEDFEDQMRFAVLLLWSQFDELQMDDEQQAYFEIAEKFKQVDYESVRDDSYIFWGFQFLSGSQIDFLQGLAVKHDVYIPVPKFVYDNASDFDWVRWANYAEIIRVEEALKQSKVEVARFPKNYLNQYLNETVCDGQDIYLAQRGLQFDEILELPIDNYQFKATIDFVHHRFDTTFEKIESQIGKSIESVLKKVDADISLIIEQQDFTSLKVLYLFKNTLQEWVKENSAQDVLDHFLIKLVRSISLLNAPRNFFVPVIKENVKNSVYQLNSTFYGLNKKNIIIGQGKYANLYQHYEMFSIETQKKLATIGPVKRADFELLYIKDNILNLAKNGELLILLETGLEKTDIGWAEIVEYLDYQIQPLERADNLLSLETSLHKQNNYQLDTLSATKLQSFIDCPQQFYFKYVDKKSPFINLDSFVSSRERGVLQHLIIKEYCENNNELLETNLYKCCDDVLNQYLAVEKKKVSYQESQSAYFELFNYTKAGIEKVFTLKEKFVPERVLFEEKLTKEKVNGLRVDGEADCLIETSDFTMILDFKRSKYSVPGKKEVIDFEKIQLWFYAKYARYAKPIKAIGYVNLSEPDESIMFSFDKALKDQLKDCFKFYDLSEGLFEKYSEVESAVISEMKNSTYPASPRKHNTCEFCFINKVCEKNNE